MILVSNLADNKKYFVLVKEMKLIVLSNLNMSVVEELPLPSVRVTKPSANHCTIKPSLCEEPVIRLVFDRRMDRERTWAIENDESATVTIVFNQFLRFVRIAVEMFFGNWAQG